MNDAEFEFLRAMLKTQSGLALTAEKRYLVESRLTPLCRKFNLNTISDLVMKLRSSRDLALEKAIIEAMTTNETFFFRDKTPFDLFKEHLLPKAIAARSLQRRIRIWCAAASTGQEPYTLAMIVDEAKAKMPGWAVEIIATDICDEVLDRARSGLYTQFEVQRGLPVQMMLKYFTQEGDHWRIAQSMRSMVTFKNLNLIKDFSSQGIFDIVFCRNVLIYFDALQKSDVLRRISNVMAPDAVLLMGAAETVIGLSDTLAAHPEHRGAYIPSKAVRSAPVAAPAISPVRLAVAR
jgi:chemotaxis protein methyltransferase CheR